MLTQLKHDLEVQASLAPEYVRDSRDVNMINTFANKYCEALDTGDERNKNIYYSCLLLKFWNRIVTISEDKNYGEQMTFLIKNKQITLEDIFHEVCSCINYALEMRKWQDPKNKINAQQCINQVISSRAAGELLRPFNLKKNEGAVYTKSLDETYDDDDKISLGDTIADEDERKNQGVIDMIQLAINNNRIVEAIIFDTIAFADCQKYEKTKATITNDEGEEEEISKQVTSFWAYKLVKELNDINDNYREYFVKTYDVDENKLNAALEALHKANNQKKYRMIESAQNYGKTLLA